MSKEDVLAGVALRLAQKGVPAVVAMQHKIELATSTDFSQVFYDSLGEGDRFGTIENLIDNEGESE